MGLAIYLTVPGQDLQCEVMGGGDTRFMTSIHRQGVKSLARDLADAGAIGFARRLLNADNAAIRLNGEEAEEILQYLPLAIAKIAGQAVFNAVIGEEDRVSVFRGGSIGAALNDSEPEAASRKLERLRRIERILKRVASSPGASIEIS